MGGVGNFRRPILEGDNRWRGHAAAFLKYAKLKPEALLKGRVKQVREGGRGKFEAERMTTTAVGTVYFMEEWSG